jgi:tetratricopeptide (TPR) repeat protein
MSLVLATAIICACALAGCFDDAGVRTNQQLLRQQQAELDQLKEQVAALQIQRPAYSTVASPAGACDKTIMREATRKGGERFAAGDFVHAIGYYQDAVTACPKSAQTQLDLARSYEAIGDHASAIEHYRLAAEASGANADPDAVRQARQALGRLGG